MNQDAAEIAEPGDIREGDKSLMRFFQFLHFVSDFKTGTIIKVGPS